MRDAINQQLEIGAQRQVRNEFVRTLAKFSAMDEFVQIMPVMPFQDSQVIFLENLSGSGSVYVGAGVPFFVSGAQTYQVFTVGLSGVNVQRAPRKELLAPVGQRDLSKYGAGWSSIYEFGGAAGFLTVATDWLYLGADMAWHQALIGTTPLGMPFGRSATDQSLAGRYYEVEWDFTVDVGAPTIYIAHDINGAVKPSVPISAATGTPNRGLSRIGDAYISPVGTAAFGQSGMLNSGNWTITLQNNVNATFTFNRLTVIRQGF